MRVSRSNICSNAPLLYTSAITPVPLLYTSAITPYATSQYTTTCAVMSLSLAYNMCVNYRCIVGRTLLEWAVTYKNVRKVILLIRYNADVNGTHGYPIRWSARNSDVILDLLIAAGANVNLRHPWNKSALVVAIRRGSAYAVKKLLLAGADVSEVTQIRSALTYCEINSFDKVILLKDVISFDFFSERLNPKPKIKINYEP